MTCLNISKRKWIQHWRCSILSHSDLGEIYSFHCKSCKSSPHSHCGCTSKKRPTVNTQGSRESNCGIFLVVSFLSLRKSHTSAPLRFWSKKLPANAAFPRSSLFQGPVYTTECIRFPRRKPILSNVQQEKQVLPLTLCPLQSQSPEATSREVGTELKVREACSW